MNFWYFAALADAAMLVAAMAKGDISTAVFAVIALFLATINAIDKK